MYSGREMSSSMTKSVMKSLAIGKSIMPPSEKSMSGKTSVPIQPAWRDSASSALPGRSAAWAAKAPSPALVRSAMTRMASRPMTSMTPWAATPKGSSLKPGVSALPEPSRTASQRAAGRSDDGQHAQARLAGQTRLTGHEGLQEDAEDGCPQDDDDR